MTYRHQTFNRESEEFDVEGGGVATSFGKSKQPGKASPSLLGVIAVGLLLVGCGLGYFLFESVLGWDLSDAQMIDLNDEYMQPDDLSFADAGLEGEEEQEEFLASEDPDASAVEVVSSDEGEVSDELPEQSESMELTVDQEDPLEAQEPAPEAEITVEEQDTAAEDVQQTEAPKVVDERRVEARKLPTRPVSEAPETKKPAKLQSRPKNIISSKGPSAKSRPLTTRKAMATKGKGREQYSRSGNGPDGRRATKRGGILDVFKRNGSRGSFERRGGRQMKGRSQKRRGGRRGRRGLDGEL